MSYFEKTKLTDTTGTPVNPATEDSLTLLRRIFQLLKPLGIVAGAGSNRLSVDVNNVTGGTIGTVTTVGTVTAVTTVNTVANQTNMAGITAFDLMRSMSRMAYSNGPRANLV